MDKHFTHYRVTSLAADYLINDKGVPYHVITRPACDLPDICIHRFDLNEWERRTELPLVDGQQLPLRGLGYWYTGDHGPQYAEPAQY